MLIWVVSKSGSQKAESSPVHIHFADLWKLECKDLWVCSGNAKSQLEAMIEHLVRRQGQPRGAQVHAMYLRDQKGWSQDPPLPSPHLRVGSGGNGVFLRSLPT